MQHRLWAGWRGLSLRGVTLGRALPALLPAEQTGTPDLATGAIWARQQPDVKRDTSRLTLLGHTGTVRGVAFSPDGKILASAGAGGLRLWDVPTGKSLATLEANFGG